MSGPKVLDLFCGAGGASVGYHRAWPDADITGVDIVQQKRYPFRFVQADAMTFPLDGYDFIHASPPCQAYTSLRALQGGRAYPDLLAATRARLVAHGAPWIIENVPGAPFHSGVLLCGSMFGLDVRRHRWFESSALLFQPPCNHVAQTPRFRSLDKRRVGELACVVGVHGHTNYAGEQPIRERAMGIDWMDPHELTQAIPPAYTEYLARQYGPLARMERAS